MYAEDDMLMLSGIQHFMFCPRQWALIHLEQQWNDNKLTIQGQILHSNVDNPFYRQKNGDTITLRSVHIASQRLGLYGISDAVELLPSDTEENAITHDRYPGFWKPYPVEYKRGHRKQNECDEVQLAAQVICLEEMYGIHIPYAALYYNEVKHREVVSISDSLRQLTQQCADKMHEIFKSRQIPPANMQKFCKNCSLKDICMPEISECMQVGNYLKRNLYEDIT
jgi:CRISPR-associated exonuclease Cas4